MISAMRDDMRKGKQTYVQGYDDPVQGTMTEIAGRTITPGSAEQRTSGNQFLLSDIVVPGFNMPAANIIAKGKSITIYGRTVNGTYEGYVAGPKDIYNRGVWGSGLSQRIVRGTAGSTAIQVNTETYYCQIEFSKNYNGYKTLVIEHSGIGNPGSTIFHRADNSEYYMDPGTKTSAKITYTIPAVVQTAGNKETWLRLSSSGPNGLIYKIYCE